MDYNFLVSNKLPRTHTRLDHPYWGGSLRAKTYIIQHKQAKARALRQRLSTAVVVGLIIICHNSHFSKASRQRGEVLLENIRTNEQTEHKKNESIKQRLTIIARRKFNKNGPILRAAGNKSFHQIGFRLNLLQREKRNELKRRSPALLCWKVKKWILLGHLSASEIVPG